LEIVAGKIAHQPFAGIPDDRGDRHDGDPGFELGSGLLDLGGHE
jgi:hypothetical protein